jgi:hypothetical protein
MTHAMDYASAPERPEGVDFDPITTVTVAIHLAVALVLAAWFFG